MRVVRRLASRLGPRALLIGLPLLSACGSDALPERAEEPLRVTTSVDRAQVTIGDLVRYAVTVDALRGPEVEVADPVIDGQIAGLEVLDHGVERRDRRRRVAEEHWWRLRAKRVGSFVLPELQVTLRERDGREVASGTGDEVYVEVVSVLDENAADIRDVKPLRRLGFRHWPWLGGAAAALLLVAGWWWWRQRRRHREDEEVVLDPAAVALAELERLHRTDFSALEQVRRYYFAISQVLRSYVEARFGLNATDLTTEEILARLGTVRDLSDEGGRHLGSFLRSTDAVKYAALVPSKLEIEETHSLARRFVETTRPVEEETLQEATS